MTKRLTGLYVKRRQTARSIPARFTAKAAAVYGIDERTWNLFRAIHPNFKKTPLFKYYCSRVSAKRRGVAWKLTFMEWWAIWYRSGKYPLRGSGTGKYTMGRLFDDGPYEVGNVYITKNNNAHRTVFNRLNAMSHQVTNLPIDMIDRRDLIKSQKPDEILERMGY